MTWAASSTRKLNWVGALTALGTKPPTPLARKSRSRSQARKWARWGNPRQRHRCRWCPPIWNMNKVPVSTTAMLGATGAVGDYIEGLICVVATAATIASATQGRQRHRIHGAAQQCRRRRRHLLCAARPQVHQRHHAGLASDHGGRRHRHRDGKFHLMLSRRAWGTLRPPTVAAGGGAGPGGVSTGLFMWQRADSEVVFERRHDARDLER